MFAASLIGYISGEVAERDVDHDDDDDDEKGQWNRSIASLRSELLSNFQIKVLLSLRLCAKLRTTANEANARTLGSGDSAQFS